MSGNPAGPHTHYAPSDLHYKLCAVALSGLYKDPDRDQIGAQALHCPYYVPLEGHLGSDWGVIVNPESSRFGLLTFEHDDCGCPPNPGADEDDEGWGRHQGSASQDGDTWSTEWRHECDDWCEPPCEWVAK